MTSDEIRDFGFRAKVRYGACVTVKGSPRQMALPGALIGHFPAAFTVVPSERTSRRQRARDRLARGDVT